MVVMKDGVNESSLNRRRQHDFPTPESPISSSLICSGIRCFAPRTRTGRLYADGRHTSTYEKIVVPSASHDDLLRERRVVQTLRLQEQGNIKER